MKPSSTVYKKICDLIDLKPKDKHNSSIQEPTPILKQIMADLANMIGIGYFSFDSPGP